MTEDEDRLFDLLLYEVAAVAAAILFCFGLWLVLLARFDVALPTPVAILILFPAAAWGIATLAGRRLRADPAWQGGLGIPARYWSLQIGLSALGLAGLAFALTAGAA